MTNCSELVSDDTNALNQSVIWLQEDHLFVYSSKFINYDFLLTFIIIFISIFVIQLCFLSACIYYDRKQRKVLLFKFNNSHVTQNNIEPLLEEQCEYNRDVINLILEYASITNYIIDIKSTWASAKNYIFCSDIYIDTKWRNGTVCHVFERLVLFFIMNILWLGFYTPFHLSALHWDDSYRSYVEISCTPYLNSTIYGYPEQYEEYLYELTVDDFCEDYVIYAWLNKANTETHPCWMNKHNYKVRGKYYCDCNGRCGAGKNGCSNACCYCLSICVSFSAILTVCNLPIWLTLGDFSNHKVDIQTFEGIEWLPIVQDQDEKTVLI